MSLVGLWPGRHLSNRLFPGLSNCQPGTKLGDSGASSQSSVSWSSSRLSLSNTSSFVIRAPVDKDNLDVLFEIYFSLSLMSAQSPHEGGKPGSRVQIRRLEDISRPFLITIAASLCCFECCPTIFGVVTQIDNVQRCAMQNFERFFIAIPYG